MEAAESFGFGREQPNDTANLELRYMGMSLDELEALQRDLLDQISHYSGAAKDGKWPTDSEGEKLSLSEVDDGRMPGDRLSAERALSEVKVELELCESEISRRLRPDTGGTEGLH